MSPLPLAIGLVLALALAVPALAGDPVPTKVITDALVRQAPQRDAPKVNFVVVGDIVKVKSCEAGWCYVLMPGKDGWLPEFVLLRRAGN